MGAGQFAVAAYQPQAQPRPKRKLETAYHKADASIRNIIELLEAA